MESLKSEKDKCSINACHFNVNGHCQDIQVLKNPWKETGCLYYKNKNIQTEKVSQSK